MCGPCCPENTTIATFDKTFRLPSVEPKKTRLRLSVMDRDEWTFDDLFGSVTLDLADVADDLPFNAAMAARGRERSGLYAVSCGMSLTFMCAIWAHMTHAAGPSNPGSGQQWCARRHRIPVE